MATIKDVAKKANVSVSTVSYALNNMPHVHPKTRQKIMRVAQKLHYHPNASARQLKTKRTNHIGVFVYGFSGPIFSEILEGIHQVVLEHDMTLIVSSGQSSISLLKQRQVDGAIIFDNLLNHDVIFQYATYAPVMVLDASIKGANIFPSTIDNDLLVQQLIRQMIVKGYKQFVFVSGPDKATNNHERYAGYLRALEEAQLQNLAYIQGDFTIASGVKAAEEILNMSPRPDFVYCANDEMAIGVMTTLQKNGIVIPSDIAVAGFDGSYLEFDYLKPSLTTIAIDHYEWGRSAASFLIQFLQKDVNAKRIVKPIGTIMIKEST